MLLPVFKCFGVLGQGGLSQVGLPTGHGPKICLARIYVGGYLSSPNILLRLLLLLLLILPLIVFLLPLLLLIERGDSREGRVKCPARVKEIWERSGKGPEYLWQQLGTSLGEVWRA